MSDLPKLTTSTTSSTTSTSSTSTSSTSTSTSKSTGTGLPGLSTTSTSTTTSTGLPALTTTSTSSSSTFTAPTVTVPPSHNNPYIYRTTDPNGTVFIAVGAVVGGIFLAFLMLYMCVSFRASRLAKRTSQRDEKRYFDNQNSTTYNGYHARSGSNLYEYQPSVTKLPLLSPTRSGHFDGGVGTEISTLYNVSDVGMATSKNDLTRMFISPTAEVMSHKKKVSMSNPVMLNSSTVSLQHPRNSVMMPSIYVNDDATESEYSSVAPSQSTAPKTRNNPRKTVPSMYLESLIDDGSFEER